MYKVFSNLVLSFLISFGIIYLFPQITLASEVSFEIIPNTVLGDSATVVEVKIDPQGKNINAIEGILRLTKRNDDIISAVVIETGDSAFSLWPVSPNYNAEEGIIRFTGGTARAFSTMGTILRLRIFTPNPSQISLALISGTAHLDDGLGTVDLITSRAITISTVKSIPNPISPTSVDSIPPNFDIIEISKDSDVFDGNPFVSFYASDDNSGIDRYEVTENQIVTEVKNGTYVFLDPERKNEILITAYDKAGNSISVKVPNKYDEIIHTAKIVGTFILVLLLIIYYCLKLRK